MYQFVYSRAFRQIETASLTRRASRISLPNVTRICVAWSIRWGITRQRPMMRVEGTDPNSVQCARDETGAVRNCRRRRLGSVKETGAVWLSRWDLFWLESENVWTPSRLPGGTCEASLRGIRLSYPTWLATYNELVWYRSSSPLVYARSEKWGKRVSKLYVNILSLYGQTDAFLWLFHVTLDLQVVEILLEIIVRELCCASPQWCSRMRTCIIE